jgi:hypothetical protein
VLFPLVYFSLESGHVVSPLAHHSDRLSVLQISLTECLACAIAISIQDEIVLTVKGKVSYKGKNWVEM